MIWWSDLQTSTQYQSWQTGLNNGTYEFARWGTKSPSVNLFATDVTGASVIDWKQVKQGGLGTCYIKAAMSALAEFPTLVQGAFVNTQKNNEGIYTARFYIRGKPWLVTVDDYMLYTSADSQLTFGQLSMDEDSIWAAVLEKAWAKVKGNYFISKAGFTNNGIRALTGVPVFQYDYDDAELSTDNMYTLMNTGEKANYIMAAQTEPTGSDVQLNGCGLRKSHAYTILGAFMMTDSVNSKLYKMVVMRDPYGSNAYSWTWRKADPNWTAELIGQIPYGFDVTA